VNIVDTAAADSTIDAAATNAAAAGAEVATAAAAAICDAPLAKAAVLMPYVALSWGMKQFSSMHCSRHGRSSCRKAAAAAAGT
jgi:hypothetical protein